MLRELPRPYISGNTISHQENRLVLGVTHAETREPAVLKCLLRPYSDDERRDFAREYLLLDAVAHPYWVRVGKFGELVDSVFFTLEEVSGVPLSEFPWLGWSREVLEISRRILSGLDALHRLGFAQLDLKPEQVLISWEGTGSGGWGDDESDGIGARIDLRMLDLGLAAPFGLPLKPTGTVGYMAPEILTEQLDWDGRVDLYSFGAVLHELLLGRPVFSGNSAREILNQQLQGTPAVVADGDSPCPPDLIELLRDLLAHDPDQRPRDAWEVWSRLRELAPPRVATELPAQLTGSPDFMFRGRDDEIESFVLWSDAHRGPEVRTCVVAGETGVGRRRLGLRLAAIAQTRGWHFDDKVGSARGSAGNGGDTSESRLGRLWRELDAGGNGGSTERRSVIELRVEPRPIVPGFEGPSLNGARSGKRLSSSAPLSTLSQPSSPSADLYFSLSLLASDELAALARSRGIESDALADVLGRLAIGSPRLLLAFLSVVPREVDLASRHFQDDELLSAIDALEPPREWIEWAQALLDQDPGCADWLVELGLFGGGDFGAGFVEIADHVPRALLDEMAGRGLFEVSRSRVRLTSPVWGRAFGEADPVRSKAVGRELLRTASVSDEASPVGFARLAIRLQDTPALQRFLEPALEYLDARFFVQDEFELFCDALRAAPKVRLSQEAALRIVKNSGVLGLVASQSLPDDLSGLSDEVSRFLELWREAGSRRGDLRVRIESSELLESNLRDVLVATHHLLSSVLKDEDGYGPAEAQLSAFRERGDLSREENIRVATEIVAILAIDRRGEQALALVTELGEWVSDLDLPQRSRALNNVGLAHFAAGNLPEAENCFLGAYDIAVGIRLKGIEAAAVNNLGGAAYETGNLSDVAEWSGRVFRRAMKESRWSSCVLSLANLALVETQLGRLGTALSSVRDGSALTTGDVPNLANDHLAFIEGVVLARVGLLRRAIRRFKRQLSASSDEQRPLLLAALGEASMLFRSLRTGRASLKEAEELFRGRGALDDLADLHATWLLLECDMGTESDAHRVYESLADSFETSSPLSRTMILLAEAEMSAVGWLSVDPLSGAVEEMLRRAQRGLDQKKLGYWGWRPKWRLGQLYRARGEIAKAQLEFDAAIRDVRQLAESLPEKQHREAFLRLPAMQALLDDVSAPEAV